MNMTLSNVLIFAAGAAVGAVVTWVIMKDKYDGEYEEVYHYGDDEEEDPDDTKTMPAGSYEVKESNSITAYNDVLKNNKYVTEEESDKNEEEEDTVSIMEDRPYVIKPEDFDEFDEYEAISLTYYADGVLTDEYDEIVEDVDNIVGLDALNHFGEYEEDSVFVRNDRLRCDYEILKDYRNYADVYHAEG